MGNIRLSQHRQNSFVIDVDRLAGTRFWVYFHELKLRLTIGLLLVYHESFSYQILEMASAHEDPSINELIEYAI